MNRIESIHNFLGKPYSIRIIDNGSSIYRKLSTGHEFEIVIGKTITVYVWQTTPHLELMNIYSDISDEQTLKDLLGHIAFKLENLQAKIRVEREDLKL